MESDPSLNQRKVICIKVNMYVFQIGLRAACLLAALCVAIGTGLRCITSKTPIVTWLVYDFVFNITVLNIYNI